MKSLHRASVAIAAALMLAACGQKGGLYLQPAQPAASAPASR